MRNFPAQLALAAFAMDDATWERHPNPWSVYTRMLGLPLIALAVWGCAWIGWWSLVPIAAVAVWLWLNPRIFRRENWASRAVLGEASGLHVIEHRYRGTMKGQRGS